MGHSYSYTEQKFTMDHIEIVVLAILVASIIVKRLDAKR